MTDLIPDSITTQTEAGIELIPIGQVDALAVSVVAANLQTLLGLKTSVQNARPDPEYAYIATRQQFDALKIIKELSQEARAVYFRLGFTNLDICTPILTFVFGESQLGGSTALVSINRLQGNGTDLAYERAAKISLHEVGHILGLEHCWELRCLMHFSRDVAQLDSLPLSFCETCQYESNRRLRDLP